MEIRTAGGLISAYGLAVGYVESVYHGRVNVCLWAEHGVYHVRAHDHGERRRVFWESFRLLSDARRCFRKAGERIADPARPVRLEKWAAAIAAD